MKPLRFGFSLIELVISMTLGLVLLTFLVGAVVAGKKSALQTEQLAQLQHQAQLAHGLFQSELQNLWFAGGRSWAGVKLASSLIGPVGADCEFPPQAGSFPVATLLYSPVHAQTVTAATQCLPGIRRGSEWLQIRRLVGVAVSPAQMQRNLVYFDASAAEGRFVHSNSPNLMASLWPFRHVIYYIQQQDWAAQQVPVLMRKRLLRNNSGQVVMSAESVLDGVELFALEFGIDSNGDTKPDLVLPTSQMTTALWQKTIIYVRYHLLLRGLLPDPAYRNSQLYQLGAVQFQAPGDHYRRLLISSSVMIRNAQL